MERPLVKVAICLLVITLLTASSLPTRAIVGVKVGDWVKYLVSVSWESTVSGSTAPTDLMNTEWVMFEVTNVVGNDITANGTIHYKNGTQTSKIQSGNALAQTGELGGMFIQAEMRQGDSIYVPLYGGSSKTFTFNETIPRNYLGITREVNHLETSYSYSGSNIQLIGYWDKSTGAVCELAYTVHYSYAGDYTNFSLSFTLTETNIWAYVPIWTQLWLWATIIIVAAVITVVVLLFRKYRGPPRVETVTSETSQIA